MRKTFFSVTSIVIALSMVGSAHADVNSWTGLYAGANAGFTFNDAQLEASQLGFTSPISACHQHSNFSKFFSGAQFGYSYQFPNKIVSGIEANVTLNNDQKHTFTCNSQFNPGVYDRFAFRNQMQTALKGRVGLAEDWKNIIFLPYVTAGMSVANLGLTYANEGSDYYSKNASQLGWLVGVGIEWAFMQHWSARAEYDFVDYGNAMNLNLPTIYDLNDPGAKAKVNLNSNNIMLAINYWI